MDSVTTKFCNHRFLAQVTVVLIFLILAAILLILRPISSGILPKSGIVGKNVLQKLFPTVLGLENLNEQQNHELQWILANFSQEGLMDTKEDMYKKLTSTLEGSTQIVGQRNKLCFPSKEYENKRRSVYRGVQEMWYYISQELEKLKKKKSNLTSSELEALIQEIITSGKEHKLILLTDLEDLSNMEGHDSWRATEGRFLSDLVQKRFRYLQNPKDCSKAKKLVCNPVKVNN